MESELRGSPIVKTSLLPLLCLTFHTHDTNTRETVVQTHKTMVKKGGHCVSSSPPCSLPSPPPPSKNASTPPVFTEKSDTRSAPVRNIHKKSRLQSHCQHAMCVRSRLCPILQTTHQKPRMYQQLPQKRAVLPPCSHPTVVTSHAHNEGHQTGQPTHN